jgi:hypothetical protein
MADGCPQRLPDVRDASLRGAHGPPTTDANSFMPLSFQEDDEETPQRRRMSADGQATAEKPLEADMVNHVVDALFDRCRPTALTFLLQQGRVIMQW